MNKTEKRIAEIEGDAAWAAAVKINADWRQYAATLAPAGFESGSPAVPR